MVLLQNEAIAYACSPSNGASVEVVSPIARRPWRLEMENEHVPIRSILIILIG